MGLWFCLLIRSCECERRPAAPLGADRRGAEADRRVRPEACQMGDIRLDTRDARRPSYCAGQASLAEGFADRAVLWQPDAHARSLSRQAIGGIRRVVPISNLVARHAGWFVRCVWMACTPSGGSERSHRSEEARRHGPSVQHTTAVPSVQQHQGPQKPIVSDAQASAA